MASEDGQEPSLVITPSRGFPSWLASTGGSLAFSTYQAGKIFFIGVKPDGQLSFFERTFPRAMAVGVSEDGQSLLLSTQFQVYRFDNLLEDGQKHGMYDALYAPHATWITGDLDIHAIAFGADQRPIFANTLFNCIATVSDGHSFKEAWRPPFISRLAAEDRCHLNGLTFDAGNAIYATCASQSDIVDGWRDRRDDGGVVVDISTDKIIAGGLSMPHSPRCFADRLWILNSGTGELGWIHDEVFEPLAFCPGYARGLAFVGRKGVIGLSKMRRDTAFQGLALGTKLETMGAEARCGLHVVDVDTGDCTDWLRIDGAIEEIFDVSFLPNVRCPAAIGLAGNEVYRAISIDN